MSESGNWTPNVPDFYHMEEYKTPPDLFASEKENIPNVYAPGGPAFLAHTMLKVINIVGLTALRLAFFMGYEYDKVVQWFLY